MTATQRINLFKAKAEAASTTVVEADALQDAVEYALRLCSEKTFSRPAESLSGNADKESEKRKTVFAAPGLPEDVFLRLALKGKENGVNVVAKNIRRFKNGVDVGFSLADAAIAETATCVLRCEQEDARLASMTSEIHVVALPTSQIVETSYEIESFLRESMQNIMYTAFISGCSRTSDIERVLALGVHGPLELHVVLLKEQPYANSRHNERLSS